MPVHEVENINNLNIHYTTPLGQNKKASLAIYLLNRYKTTVIVNF